MNTDRLILYIIKRRITKYIVRGHKYQRWIVPKELRNIRFSQFFGSRSIKNVCYRSSIFFYAICILNTYLTEFLEEDKGKLLSKKIINNLGISRRQEMLCTQKKTFLIGNGENLIWTSNKLK